MEKPTVITPDERAQQMLNLSLTMEHRRTEIYSFPQDDHQGSPIQGFYPSFWDGRFGRS